MHVTCCTLREKLYSKCVSHWTDFYGKGKLYKKEIIILVPSMCAKPSQGVQTLKKCEYAPYRGRAYLLDSCMSGPVVN